MRYELERTPLGSADGLVVATTRWLESNELALMLIEENKFTADTLSEHRFQSIYVGRGDSVFEFPRDLGLSTKFPNTPGFILFSGGADTVAQLMDMADAERGENKTQKVLEEAKERSTLIADAVRETEQKHELVRRNSRTLRNKFDIRHERKYY